MNVEFANIWVEDSLQYHCWEFHWLSQKTDQLKEINAIHHESIAWNDWWVNLKNQRSIVSWFNVNSIQDEDFSHFIIIIEK